MSAGHHTCACETCFELYVGEPGERCNECDDAGCELDGDCQRDTGCDDCPGCKLCDPHTRWG